MGQGYLGFRQGYLEFRQGYLGFRLSEGAMELLQFYLVEA